MKKTILRICSVLITLALTFTGSSALGYILRPTNTDGTYLRVREYHNLPENLLEVVVYGSSHAFKGVNVRTLYENYGIGAYDYGFNWQKINTTRLFIEDSLKSQNPKVVVIESFMAHLLRANTNITGEIFYTRYLGDSPGRRRYLKQCFGLNPERWLSYYLPICAFHENWENLEKNSFRSLLDPKVVERYYMGFKGTDHIKAVTLGDPATFQQKEFDKNALAELDAIVDLCHERNIEIVFMTIPYEGEYMYADAMEKYAQEHGCAYINLFEHVEEIGLNPETDFSDKGHVNTEGATKVADYLGAYLKQHYELTDMRTIENNPWEMAMS